MDALRNFEKERKKVKVMKNPSSEEIELAISTVDSSIKRGPRPELGIAILDILDLLRVPIPRDPSQWGSITNLTKAISNSLSDMGYVKLQVSLDGSSLSRWYKKEYAEEIIKTRFRGNRVGEHTQRNKSPKVRPSPESKVNSKIRSTAKVAKKNLDPEYASEENRRTAEAVIAELRDSGYTTRMISEASGVAASVISRVYVHRGSPLYERLTTSVLRRLLRGYAKLTIKKSPSQNIPKKTNRKRAQAQKASEHALLQSAFSNVEKSNSVNLPKEILSHKDCVSVIKALIDAGQSVTIEA